MTGVAGRGRGDAGFVAAEFAFGFAVLLLPVAMIVLTLPSWSERQATGRAIAREVARVVARDGSCNVAVAFALVDLMGVNLGIARSDLHLELDCSPWAELPPGGEVQASVTVRMPAVDLPALGSIGEWSWTARNRQPVDRYGSAW